MQQNKLYVGNLSYSVEESHLRDLFSSYGEITDVALIKDRETGRSKGFAFITFAADEAAAKALEQNGKDFEGRPLKVTVAEERKRTGGFGGGKRNNFGDNKRGGFGGKRGGFRDGRRGGHDDRSSW